MKFQEILKDLLLEANLNQTELARKINVKPSQISEWLKGKANPGYETLRNISIALDIPSDYLLGLEDDFGVRFAPTAGTMREPASLTEKEKALLQAFRNLLPETQNFVLRAVGITDQKLFNKN